ncbi:peptidylprolyl isomerase [uncultured Polaribacter sp.]|uniref:FKBP-type peptidyl-prolyl cis-trans isomerase n=1 Tax=uncultured Polaribacter sp. TaxID=174711 RepID=UPI0026375D1E|nr:peptidylprolyl isomerase [uncultured Polaribacter sp.]
MNKLKLILLLLSSIVFYNCDDNNRGFINPFEGTDYEQLAISDNDSILKFLNTHYYDAVTDSIKLISSNETSLFEDNNTLEIKDLVENDIKYTLYTYIVDEGEPSADKGNPSIVDSVFTTYSGIELLNNTIDRDPFDSNTQIWIGNSIVGWANGFTNFRNGNNITNNGPITYNNTGKGFIFIPSGLAYPSIDFVFGQNDPNALPYDRILVFKIELLDFVVDTDHDNDGVPSIQEDANGDGNPRNDFSDPNFPTRPDYLNPNIK